MRQEPIGDIKLGTPLEVMMSGLAFMSFFVRFIMTTQFAEDHLLHVLTVMPILTTSSSSCFSPLYRIASGDPTSLGATPLGGLLNVGKLVGCTSRIICGDSGYQRYTGSILKSPPQFSSDLTLGPQTWSSLWLVLCIINSNIRTTVMQ